MPHITLVEQGSEKSHRVEGSEVLVGRDPACGVFLEGEKAKTVSGRHARFFFDDAKWYVEDAGSRNGTYIGKRKLEPGSRHAIAVGDVIGLGLTGTQLSVREAAGRGFAATILEAPPPTPVGKPERAHDHHRIGVGEEVRVVLRGVQSGSRSVAQGDRVTIGRALECLIRVEGESATSVSRVHAEITIENEQVTVRDGGSRHGTFLNGKKIDGATPIRPTDVIMLGPGGPTFTVEEASSVPAGQPGAPAPVSPPAREPAIGPSAVRPGASKVQPSANERASNVAVAAAQPTPLDQPAYRQSTQPDHATYQKSTPPHPQPARRIPTPKEETAIHDRPGPSRSLVLLGVVLLLVAAAAFFLMK